MKPSYETRQKDIFGIITITKVLYRIICCIIEYEKLYNYTRDSSPLKTGKVTFSGKVVVSPKQGCKLSQGQSCIVKKTKTIQELLPLSKTGEVTLSSWWSPLYKGENSAKATLHKELLHLSHQGKSL